jgi:hypothetical protein
MFKKIKTLFLFIILFVSCLCYQAIAQNNNTNTLQPDLGGSGASGMGGVATEPATFDPGPVDGNSNDPLDPASNPGGPGGDIDDLGEIPLDSGVSILLILGLLGGLAVMNARKEQKSGSEFS